MTGLLTAVQVAELLGVHVNTVKKLPALDLAYYRIGTRGDRRYESEDVRLYKASRRVGGPAILPYEIPVEPDNPPSDIKLEPIAKGTEQCGAMAFDGLERKRCRRPASFRREVEHGSTGGTPVCKQHSRLALIVAFVSEDAKAT